MNLLESVGKMFVSGWKGVVDLFFGDIFICMKNDGCNVDIWVNAIFLFVFVGKS